MESNSTKQYHTPRVHPSSDPSQQVSLYDGNIVPSQDGPKKRFEPIPVETSKGSTRKRNASAVSKNKGPPSYTNHVKEDSNTSSSNISAEGSRSKRFSPQPIETERRTNRRKVDVQESQTTNGTDLSHKKEEDDNDNSMQSSHRKFAPMLLETTKRSRKSSDSNPAVLPQDKTNVSPGDVNGCWWSKNESNKESNVDKGNGSNQHIHDKKTKQSRPNTQAIRSHSFKVPELDAIESSESEKSDESKRPSSNHLSDSNQGYENATWVRESVDERFSGYLLDLAAQAAQKQLRDQEAVVFPTTDFHEPVHHFVDDDKEFGSPADKSHPENVMSRRDSAYETFALQEMRRHGERIKREQEDANLGNEGHIKTVGLNVNVDDAAKRVAKKSVDAPERPTSTQPQEHRDPEVKQMRKHASPPMLGGDIDFPRCPSPEHAVFSVRDGLKILETENKEEEEGLWNVHHPKTHEQEEPAKQPEGRPSGLWGGCCTEPEVKITTSIGLATPRRTPTREKSDPFSSSADPSSQGLTRTSTGPITPPFSVTPSPEEIEAILDKEFPDSYITHVYNYVSLGFPAIGRRFDQHLSEDTGISIEELREDDKLAQPMGYLRLGEQEPSHQQVGVSESQCKRWLALRIYIRQWGMENIVNSGKKRRTSDDPNRAWGLPGAWGAAGRRGSWAN